MPCRQAADDPIDVRILLHAPHKFDEAGSPTDEALPRERHGFHVKRLAAEYGLRDPVAVLWLSITS